MRVQALHMSQRIIDGRESAEAIQSADIVLIAFHTRSQYLHGK
jgi:hypothetical protein